MLPLRTREDQGTDDNKEVLHIPKISSIIGASTSDLFSVISGHSLGKFYPSAEMHSMYSTAPADWAILMRVKFLCLNISTFVGYLMPNWSL